jgi:hypothetical protein
MRTYRIVFGALLSLMVAISSCDDSDDDDDGGITPAADIITLKEVALTGTQEVPPVTTQATATFKGSYNNATNRISYNITFQNITPTGIHFHKGAVGEDGDIIIPINPGSDPYSGTNPYNSPISGNTAALTAAQEADLLAGGWYLNIHSSQYPDGELRAQITR